MKGSPTTVMAEPPQCPGDEKRSMNIIVVTKVGPHDVLMGRGTPAMAHKGNIEFRRLVASRKLEYVQALRRREKDDIAREIVSTVKSRNGLFLRKMDSSSIMRAIGTGSVVDDASKEQLIAGIPKGGCAWMTVPDDAVLLKVKQALRDDVGPVSVQKDDEHKAQEEAQCPRRKRSRLEAGPTTAATMGQATAAVNLDVATVPYLQQLVADTLQEYQQQCKRRRWSNQQTTSQIVKHPKFNLACYSQPVEETAATKARPMDEPTMTLAITAASSSPPPPPPPLPIVNTSVKGLDILQKAVILLEGAER